MPKLIFIVIFINFCSIVENVTYEIESEDSLKDIDTKFIFQIEEKMNDEVVFTIQSFPKISQNIQSYSLVFDMNFREDYESNFNDVCVGPMWSYYGAGEFYIELNVENNFKNSIIGKKNVNENDRCQTYFYYMRIMEIKLKDNNEILVGVATSYADEYPNAPYAWVRNNLGEIELVTTTNIKKYSLNFELSK